MKYYVRFEKNFRFTFKEALYREFWLRYVGGFKLVVYMILILNYQKITN